MTARFDVYQDGDGLYRFRLEASNGETVADSQAYVSLADARDGMAALQRAAAEAPLPGDDVRLHTDTGIHMHFRDAPEE